MHFRKIIKNQCSWQFSALYVQLKKRGKWHVSQVFHLSLIFMTKSVFCTFFDGQCTVFFFLTQIPVPVFLRQFRGLQLITCKICLIKMTTVWFVRLNILEDLIFSSEEIHRAIQLRIFTSLSRCQFLVFKGASIKRFPFIYIYDSHDHISLMLSPFYLLHVLSLHVTYYIHILMYYL